MNIEKVLMDVLNDWTYNDENQAGDKLLVIDASDFPKIIAEIIKRLTDVVDCSSCKHRSASKYVHPCFKCRENGNFNHYESIYR